MTRGHVVTALSLAALALGGCTEEATPAEVAPDRAAQPTTAPPAAGDYCTLYAALEDEQPDGNPYDPRTYADTIAHLHRAAEAGPAELGDEWAVLVAHFEGMQDAAATVDLSGLTEAEQYEVMVASIGQGPWPPGVDREAVEQFDRDVAALDGDAAERADDAISEATGDLCGEQK